MPEASAPREKSAAQKALEKMGLKRDIDLALHLPLRYEDETRITPIGELDHGETVQVEGTVSDSRVEMRPRRQLVVRLSDASGELVLRFLNFYPSQQKSLAAGARVRARGEVRGGFLGAEMVHPSFKVISGPAPLPTSLTPVYPATAALPQAYLRKAVDGGLSRADLREVLPPACIPEGLPPLREALRELHHPLPHTSMAALENRRLPAWRRLKWEELLAQQLSQCLALRQRAQRRAPVLRASGRSLSAALNEPVDEVMDEVEDKPGAEHLRESSVGRSARPSTEPCTETLVRRLLKQLPFTLTAAQQRVFREIEHDLVRSQPMHRLLQGDVGSGKTVVAALAACVAIDAGWQCALMAPTEILAEQHFRKLVDWLQPLLQERGQTVAWLVGSVKGKARKTMLEHTGSGHAALVVGTHAVIQDSVKFARLGLALIDEQHRFGVAQRLALRHKLEGVQEEGSTPAHDEAEPALEPHLLMMTATPIPRTLAMTYYADLAVSTIDELPPGRTPVVTRVFTHGRRDEVIARIGDEVARGRQVYWVCPLIVESEVLDLQNATETHAQLSQALPGVMVGLLHGRMPASEKAAVMSLFTSGQMPLLVATTVIEVGVDVPNASLMVIEHAERFGLAQLHQLRGRVGRGAAASVCVLLYTPPLSDSGKQRLKAMAQTNDGFEIARRDLEIRGPGEFMGARQSGDALLRFADLEHDGDLLEHARALAPRLLDEHPDEAQAHVQRWLASRAEYLKA